MRKLAWLLLFPALAFGQTLTITNAPSIWSPQTWITTKVTGTVSLIDANGLMVNTAPIGQIAFLQVTLTASFPVQPAAVTITRVRIDLTQIGVDGWTGGWTATYVLPTPLSVPSGAVTTMTYNSSIFGASLVATAAVPAATIPTVTASASSIGISICTGTSAHSVPCTSPALSQLTAPDGSVWTMVGASVFRNGVNTNQPFSDANAIYVFGGSTPEISVSSPAHGHLCFNATWGGC